MRDLIGPSFASKYNRHNRRPGQAMGLPIHRWNNPWGWAAFLIVLLGVFSLSGCSGLADANTSRAGAASASPTFTTQPVSQDITVGQSATFSMTAGGTSPLSYQWKKNGAAISGATSSSYTTPAASSSDDRALFTAVVTNSAGSATSNAGSLNVVATVAVTITVSPNSTTVTTGATQQFTAVVTGNSNASVTWGVSGSGLQRRSVWYHFEWRALHTAVECALPCGGQCDGDQRGGPNKIGFG
jgi:Immunoglobulin I-set domain